MPVNTLKPLTKKQNAILEYILKFQARNGHTPSLGEIANEFNLKANSTVHRHLKLIEKKGYLRKEAFQSRGIYPIIESEAFTQIPLVGKIAAGEPIEPIENPEPIAVPRYLLKGNGNYYALEVKGNSMIQDDVWDGDLILIKHQNVANKGDVVVAVYNDEVTLKRFGGVEHGKVILIPRNPHMQPFEVDPQTTNFQIRGIFAGLIRRKY